MKLSRRTLLKALGLAGGSYFLPSTARAQTADVPKRLLIFYTPHGTLRSKWAPVAVPGMSAPSERSFALGPLHQPLQRYQDRLIFIDGLDMTSGLIDQSPAANAHIAGQTHSLSAIARVGESLAGGPSIDQVIASALNSPNPVTQLPSLEVSSRYNEDVSVFSTSWSGPGQRVPSEPDPGRAFDRLFPNPMPADNTAEMRRARQEKSVLDFVLREYDAVKPKLSAADRLRFDAHQALVRDLESRLSVVHANSCAIPDRTMLVGGFGNEPGCSYGAGERCLIDGVPIFSKLITAAFACDVTRVITYDIDQVPDSVSGYTPGLAQTSDIHDLIHKTAENGALKNDPGAVQIASQFYLAYAQHFANLLDLLDAVEEPDGKTLLDHTIVLWTSEIASGSHDLHQVPFVIAGGGSAGLRTGRYLSVRGPQNDLYVALANKMGVAISTFGNPATCDGPLAAL